jgi:hypothetical protein
MSVQAFNPASFQDKLKERVKEIFGEIVPDEAWEQMLKAETDKFIRDEMPNIVKRELHNETVRVVQAWMKSADWHTTMHSMNGIPKPREIFLAIVANEPSKLMGSMMAHMMDSMFAAAFQQAAAGLSMHQSQYHNNQRF